MPQLDRRRLAKLCALLSSDKDGEVLAAARKANQMVRQSGLSWEAVLVALPAPKAKKAPPQPKPPPTPVSPILEKIKFCRRYPGFLYSNEQDFLFTLQRRIKYGNEPTEKQSAWLEKILARILAERE